MTEFNGLVTCPVCGRSFEVELRKMRRNIHNRCPVCGTLNSISEGQAIHAQRLLESLELKEKERKFGRLGPVEKVLFPRAEQGDGGQPGPHVNSTMGRDGAN
jgi:predicted nucleic acid-binding Zn ribbon protein